MFSGHAFQRMFKRDIGEDKIIETVKNGEVIDTYTDDSLYSSFLILGKTKAEPLHVVVALDKK